MVFQDENIIMAINIFEELNGFLTASERDVSFVAHVDFVQMSGGKKDSSFMFLTSTHNQCFGAKIRKIGIPLHTPVLLYKSWVWGGG